MLWSKLQLRWEWWGRWYGFWSRWRGWIGRWIFWRRWHELESSSGCRKMSWRYFQNIIVDPIIFFFVLSFLPRFVFNFVNLFFTAVITTRHELLEDFYAKVSPALIQRFKEREENVKADIFHAYVALLKQTKTAILPQLALQGMV